MNSKSTAASAKMESKQPSGVGRKRPAWDLKGKIADMEKVMQNSTKRLESLETEKQDLKEDVEMKQDVVVKSSEEIKYCIIYYYFSLRYSFSLIRINLFLWTGNIILNF